MSLSTSNCSVQIKADHSGTPGNLPKGICTSTVIINGGTDGFTFPRILRKWEQSWKRTAFDAVFILGGINEVGALMDSGMDETSHRELLLHSADALSALLSGLSSSGCPQIFVLEPFLFDTPQYLKSWMGTLEEVRGMIRQTVASVLPAFLVYVPILVSMWLPIIYLPISLRFKLVKIVSAVFTCFQRSRFLTMRYKDPESRRSQKTEFISHRRGITSLQK